MNTSKALGRVILTLFILGRATLASAELPDPVPAGLEAKAIAGNYLFRKGSTTRPGQIYYREDGALKVSAFDFFTAYMGYSNGNSYLYGYNPYLLYQDSKLSGPVLVDAINFNSGTELATLYPYRAHEGTWFTYDGSQYRTCKISRLFNRLTFYNENGGSASGYMTSAGALRADQWNLNGTSVNDGKIQWANGSVWEKVPDLSGVYLEGQQKITQNGLSFTLTNENGGTSSGTILSPTRIQAISWGGLQATVMKDGNGRVLRVNFDNGSVWEKVPTQIVGDYSLVQSNGTLISGAVISLNGKALTIRSENGGTSPGTFINSSKIRATNWGGLEGNLVKDALGTIVRVEWSNGSVWKKSIPFY